MDRDGTVIVFNKEVTKPSQIRFYRGVPEAIKKLNELGYLCIIITNQPIIEKRIITRKKADELNKLLVQKLAARGARIQAVYLCPHRYPSKCSCRKPAIGMLLKAKKRFRLDFKKSFMVGDDRRDVETGRRAKIRTILVKTGRAGKDTDLFKSDPDFRAEDLLEAARIIKRIKK